MTVFLVDVDGETVEPQPGGFYGGWVDDLLMRITEAFRTVPSFLLLLAFPPLQSAAILQLMDRVRETRVEYVVTKHGKPVAKLVPYTESSPKSFLGCMKGTVLKYDRPLDPLDDEWDINRD